MPCVNLVETGVAKSFKGRVDTMSRDTENWYLTTAGGTPTGPFTTAQIVEAWKAGGVDRATLCWRAGMNSWSPLAEVAPVASAPPLPAPIPPAARKGMWGRRQAGLLALCGVVGVSLLAVSVYYLATSLKGSGGAAETPVDGRSAGAPIMVSSMSGIYDQTERRWAVGLDREAGLQACAMWKISEIGGSRFVHRTRTDPSGGFGVRGAPLLDLFSGDWLHELRNPVVIVSPFNIGEADRLNGLTWKGTVTLCVDADRTIDRRKGSNTWSQWHNGPRPEMFDDGVIALEQRNGAWQGRFQFLAENRQLENWRIEFTAVRPEDVPQ